MEIQKSTYVLIRYVIPLRLIYKTIISFARSRPINNYQYMYFDFFSEKTYFSYLLKRVHFYLYVCIFNKVRYRSSKIGTIKTVLGTESPSVLSHDWLCI